MAKDIKKWTVSEVLAALEDIPDDATIGVRAGTDIAETDFVIGVRHEKPLGDGNGDGQVIFEH